MKNLLIGMVAAGWGLSLSHSAFAAPLPPPTLIQSACRGEDIELLIEHYVEKTAGAQLKSTVQAGLGDFGDVKGKDGKQSCAARMNVHISAESGDVVWVHYRVFRDPELRVQVSFQSIRPLSGYTLPADNNPATLPSSLLAEIPASRREDFRPVAPPGLPMPIAYLEILSEARERLISAGWHPKKTMGVDDDMNATERAYIVAGYPEVDGCAIDEDVCVLDYVDAKGDCLYLTAEDEDPKRSFVGGWSFGCEPN